MRRMNNLVTLFSAMFAFFFGSFFTTLLMNVDKCPMQKSGAVKLAPHPDIFLLILVLSAPEYESKRQAMRDTWLKLGQPLTHPYFPEGDIFVPQYDERGFLQNQRVEEQSMQRGNFRKWMQQVEEKQRGVTVTKRNIKVKHFFAIGTESLDVRVRTRLDREQAKNHDLMYLPRLHDSYSNLTEKLLHAIEALTTAYEFSYMLKVDDDTYVKVDYLLNELVSYDRKLLRKVSEYRHQPLPELYWGYFNGRANIKTKGAWSETNYVLASRYIPYALGGGYIISHKLAKFIKNNALTLSTYISEDVSMGTWLAPLRNVFRYHDTRFDTGYMPRTCRLHHLVLHKRNETHMHELYNGRRLCQFESTDDEQSTMKRKRPTEYYYNWQKTADRCCDSVAF